MRASEREEYSESLGRLQEAVRGACGRHQGWQDRVAAGIHATVEFAAADPAAAGTLTREAHSDSPGGHQRYVDALDYFTTLLGKVAPRGDRSPASTDQALVDRIATVVGVHLRSGTPEELEALAPELVYLTLLPYAGYDGARDYVESLALEA